MLDCAGWGSGNYGVWRFDAVIDTFARERRILWIDGDFLVATAATATTATAATTTLNSNTTSTTSTTSKLKTPR